MFWIFIPAIYFYIGPCFGLLNNLAQCRMRAMFCAMTLFLANVGNLLITPPLIGSLTDWFARMNYSQADALRLAMLCIVPTGLWAALYLRHCGPRYPQGRSARAQLPLLGQSCPLPPAFRRPPHCSANAANCLQS